MNGTNKASATPTIWTINETDPRLVSEIQSALNIPLPLATILVQRGCRLADEGRLFLYPTLQALPSPFLMKGMQEACELIHLEILAQKPIVIYGDYDVDGVTATAVLVNFFNDLGVSCRVCHPDRFKNGYGLKAELVEALSSNEPGLVITVDCGISDLVEIDRLVEIGWRVVVTDHHQPPGQLPNAHAILNPWQAGCQFPTKELAGVGVSFYLAMGLRNYLHQQGQWRQGQTPPNLKKLLDLVAVGTISDMVPLRRANRILTKAGLQVLSGTENPGLVQLLERCNLQRGQSVTTEDISFQVGPRLNAAGRMGDAGRASRLLSSVDFPTISQLADIIDRENMVRRELTSKLVVQAIALVEEQRQNSLPCLILHGREWHLGLLGIISSKLVDLYGKPTIIFAGSGVLKGSARSIPGLNIHEIINACSDVVLEFGGHSSAAGLSLKEEQYPSFVKLASEACRHHLARSKDEQLSLSVDFMVTEETPFADLETTCSLLAPFGQGNPEPIFTTAKPCRLRNIQVIGKEKNHVRFSAFVADRWLDGVGFGFGYIADQAVNGETMLAMAFNLRENRYNGQVRPQITLLDVQLCSTGS